MRVEAVAVGEFDAIVNEAEFRAERGSAAHGSIHVQPEIVVAADAGNFADGIDRIRRCCPRRRANEAGNQTGLDVRFDLLRQRFGAHGEVLVHFDLPQVVRAHAGDLHRLFDGGVSLCRAIGNEASIAAFAIAGELGCTFARGEQGAQRGAGRRVLNYPPASRAAGGKKFFGQPQHGDQPIEHVRFKFRACRTGGPEHALHAQSGGKQIAENGGPGGVRGKVGVEVGRLPVRDAGKDDALDVAENLIEGFALLRCFWWQLRANFSRLHARQNRKAFDAGMVVGDPVHDGVALPAEIFGRHVE